MMYVSEKEKHDVRLKLLAHKPIDAGELHILAQIRNEDLPPSVWHDTLYSCSKTIVHGLPKRHKTNWLITLTMAIASGTPHLNRETIASKVLYLSAEQKEWNLGIRCQPMMLPYANVKGFNKKWRLLYLYSEMRTQNYIEKMVNIEKPEVLVLDPLQQLIIGENKQEIVDNWLTFFDHLCDTYNITLIIVHHSRKPEQKVQESLNDMISNIRGFGKLGGWANNIIGVIRTSPRVKDTISIGFECRDAIESPEDITLNFNRSNCLFSEVIPRSDHIETFLLENCKKYNATTKLIKICATEFDVSEATIWRVWSELST